MPRKRIIKTGMNNTTGRIWRAEKSGIETMVVAFCFILLLSPATGAQLLKTGEYGAGLTLAFYQFDDARSKAVSDVFLLRQTSSSPEEEIDYLSRAFGIEDLKLRHTRSIGLRESENFTDATAFNEKQFTFNLTPRTITREEVRFDITASYGEEKILEAKDVAVGNYETVALRGGRGEFGVREFAGPKGKETVPETRALIVTVTATVAPTRGLQNRPTDISRPTDAFGSKVVLDSGDIFIMPAILNRVAPRFLVGNPPKGSITLEAVITPEGRVTNVRVLDTPDAAYNARSIEAFRQYKFNPARLNGKPTYATYRETIIFGKTEN
ncbi:MAG: energy transducer TonB [Blastocatellales bacterium]|nr:energy transducer TonB [Blastocatellales bacterium]